MISSSKPCIFHSIRACYIRYRKQRWRFNIDVAVESRIRSQANRTYCRTQTRTQPNLFASTKSKTHFGIRWLWPHIVRYMGQTNVYNNIYWLLLKREIIIGFLDPNSSNLIELKNKASDFLCFRPNGCETLVAIVRKHSIIPLEMFLMNCMHKHIVYFIRSLMEWRRHWTHWTSNKYKNYI